MAAEGKKGKKSNAPTAFMQTTDAGGYHIQETNLGPLIQEHVLFQLRDPKKGLVINDLSFPAVQIEDALSGPERQALADLVWGHMILEPIKIASYADPGGTGPMMDARKRKMLACYEYVVENLVWEHRRVLIEHEDSFVRLAARDVGRERARRQGIQDSIARLGEWIIKREGRARSIAGYTGYIVACAQSVMALQHEFYMLWSRSRAKDKDREFRAAWAQLRQLRQAQIAHRRDEGFMDELEAHIRQFKKVSGRD